MDSRRGIVQKAAPESAAPTTVNAPKTEKPGQTASTLSVTNRHGAQIGAEQNRRKATGRHRKEAPQRQSLTAEAQVLGRRDWQQAKTDNRQSPITAMPATRIAVPDTRQRGTLPLQGQKAESTHRNKAAPATYPRAPHSNRLKQPKIIYNNRYRTFF